jgi:hypothetical protein
MLIEEYRVGGENREECLVHVEKFNSMTQFANRIAAINEKTREEYASPRESSTTKGKRDFYTMEFEDALKIALQGGKWAEGVKHLEGVNTPLKQQFKGTRARQANKVQGSRVSVPRYLSNNPRAMVRREKQPAMKKALRLGVNIGYYCGTQEHHINNRGLAILGAIQDLENQGYSVELWAVCAATDHGITTIHKGQKYTAIEVRSEVLLKPQGARLVISDLAYALTSPAFFRRLGFAFIETTPANKLTKYGYGNGENTDLSSYDLTIDYVSPKTIDHYETVESAKAWAKEHLKAQIAEIENIRAA